MHLIKRFTLRGHNIWSPTAMLEAWIQLGELVDASTADLDGLAARVAQRLPQSAQPDRAARARFVERLQIGMPLAEAAGELALLLQIEAGVDVRVVRVQRASECGVWKVAVECRDHDVAEMALAAALDLLTAAMENREPENPSRLADLANLVARLEPDAISRAIIAAARDRGIPVQPLGSEGLLQLGHGVRQRRLDQLQTDRTTATAVTAAGDADTARGLLRAAGVPCADPSEVNGAPRYQLYMVSGRLVAAIGPAGAGDAHHDELPPQGEVTARVHPAVVASARAAAQAVGLDVAGVHIATRDISRPLESVGGAVLKIESRPTCPAASESATSVQVRLGEALLESVFPPGAAARVPIVAVSGVNGKTTTTRLIAHILSAAGRTVGMTCTDGIYVGGRQIDVGDCSGPQSARLVLAHPRVEAAVLETARGGILREGLGFDHCDVAVMTNIGEGDHLGLGDISTPEQLARVKQTIVEAVSAAGAAVLNAEDPLVVAMAPHAGGRVIFFALDAGHPVLAAWRAQGGRAAFVRDGSIVVAEGASEYPLLSLDRVPLTHQGRVRFQVENVLAAAAATWALGIPVQNLRNALETFTPTTQLVPGRFNLLEVNGATVVFDYGHNASSLKTILAELERFPHSRRVCVYSAAGDRRDCDLVRQGEMIGNAFDSVVLYEDYYLRGRAPGEIIGLFRQGVSSGRRTTEFLGVQGWVAALETSLSWLRPGVLALIQADVIETAVAYMRHYLATHPTTREITLSEALATAAAGPPVQEPAVAGSLAAHANGAPVAAAADQNRELAEPVK